LGNWIRPKNRSRATITAPQQPIRSLKRTTASSGSIGSTSSACLAPSETFPSRGWTELLCTAQRSRYGHAKWSY